MRCHYMSDLHLESQPFHWAMPEGDVLIVAGDVGHASCLDPAQRDAYSANQRSRMMSFFESAHARFAHVLLVAGNHEHYDGVFDDTANLLKRHLPDIAVLDDEAIEIGGVTFFGTTLWSDFDGRSPATLDGVRRRMGEFFFVKTRNEGGEHGAIVRFRPEDALRAHDKAVAALRRHIATQSTNRTVVVSHHAPSRKGLNPRHVGNGLDGAFASGLDADIAALAPGSVWVHGHTHIRRIYRVGGTVVRANCRGFDGKDASAAAFKPDAYFDM